MIPILEVIIVKEGKMHRESFRLPNVPVEDYDGKEHWNVHFNWEGNDDFTKDGIRVWTVVDLSDEEKAFLMAEGKIGVFSPLKKSQGRDLFYKELELLTLHFTAMFNGFREKWFDKKEGISIHALPKNYTGPDALSFYVDMDSLKSSE